MESLIGIIIFVAFAVLSAVGKSQARKEQEQRRQARGQQWPGPVAGPGFPGFPRPQFPPPRQAPPLPPQPMPVQPAPAPVQPASGEGVGTEGPLSESAEAEVARFDRETEQDINSAVAEVDRAVGEIAREADAVAGSDQSSRTIGQLRQDDYVTRVTPDDTGEPVFAADELQKAVVMAEVLGRPKGARYFSRSR